MRLLPKAAFQPARAVPRLEALEDRIVPYNISGNAWIHPELITLSFVPDGTVLGFNGDGSPRTSNLFSSLNSLFGSATTWQNQFLKGAQVWAQQTNINFAVVSDNGADTGATGNQQGDPNYGDIRIGGYNDGTGAQLAYAYMPPPDNNYSIAGDVVMNTGQSWNIGSTYDLFTVAAHEIGHAIGMDHSDDTTVIMSSAYPGTKTGLSSDDALGARAIYGGAGVKDAYDLAAPGDTNGTFANATNVTVSPSTKKALVTGADLTTTSDLDYYKFTAPLGSTLSVTVKVQSAGLSLLAPKVYIYNSLQLQIGSGTGAGHYGTTVTATAVIVPGLQYYIKVMGAEVSALGTGAYAVTINTGTGSNPTVPLPDTSEPEGNPRVTGGGIAEAPFAIQDLTSSLRRDQSQTNVIEQTTRKSVNLAFQVTASPSVVAANATRSLTTLVGGNENTEVTDEVFAEMDLDTAWWF